MLTRGRTKGRVNAPESSEKLPVTRRKRGAKSSLVKKQPTEDSINPAETVEIPKMATQTIKTETQVKPSTKLKTNKSISKSDVPLKKYATRSAKRTITSNDVICKPTRSTKQTMGDDKRLQENTVDSNEKFPSGQKRKCTGNFSSAVPLEKTKRNDCEKSITKKKTEPQIQKLSERSNSQLSNKSAKKLSKSSKSQSLLENTLYEASTKNKSVLNPESFKIWKRVKKSATRKSGRIYIQKNKDIYDIDTTLSPCKQIQIPQNQKKKRKPRTVKPKQVAAKKFKTTLLTTDPAFKNPCSFPKPLSSFGAEDTTCADSIEIDHEDYDASSSALHETGSTYGISMTTLPKRAIASGQDIETPVPLDRFVGPTSTPRLDPIQYVDSESPLEEIGESFGVESSINEPISNQPKHYPSRFEIPSMPRRVLATKTNLQDHKGSRTSTSKHGVDDLNESKIFDDELLRSPQKQTLHNSPLKQKTIPIDPETSLSESQVQRVYTPKYKPAKRIKRLKPSKSVKLKKPLAKGRTETTKENDVPPKVKKIIDDWASDLNSHFSEIEDTLLVVE